MKGREKFKSHEMEITKNLSSLHFKRLLAEQQESYLAIELLLSILQQ